MIDAISRIRVAVASMTSAVSAYQALLTRPPIWQGEVVEGNNRYAVAWFALANTLVELYELADGEGRVEDQGENRGGDHDAKARITGLVLQTSGEASESLPGEECRLHYCCDQQSIVAPLRRLDVERGRGLELYLEQGEAIKALVDSRPEQGLHKVDHVVLYTADAEACIALFGEPGLGIRLALDQTVPEWGGRMLFFRTGKLTLEIIAPNKGLDGDDYFWGIAYQVDNLDKLHKQLQSSGVTISDIRKGRKPGTRVATIKSHDLGIPTLLVEPALVESAAKP